MKILKLDGRFANYPRYKYALQFRGRTVRQVSLCAERKEYAKIFEKFYGPARIKNPDFDPVKATWWGQYMDNPLWMFDKKHNRIYYQDESVLSMVMLMVKPVA
jgi:hypothetical protein